MQYEQRCSYTVHSDERPLRSKAKVIDDVVNDNGVVVQEIAFDDEVVLPLQAHGATIAVSVPVGTSEAKQHYKTVSKQAECL